MQDIYQHIEDHIDEHIATLFRLVSQPSISAQRLGFDKAPALVKDIFESVGMNTDIVPVPNDGLPSVYGTAQGERTDRTLLLYTHYDVQPVDPLDLWKSDPFKPERRGDRLYGRGMSDDKGNIIARIAAIRAFNEVRGGLPCNLKFFAEGEEESGSINLPDLIEQRGQDFAADACIWEGGGRDTNNDPFMYLGLKGVLTVELSIKRLSVDAHSSLATVLPSAAWRLLDALQTIKGDGDRVLIDGFYDDVTPLSDTEEAAIAALPDETEELRQIYGVRDFVNEVSGDALVRKKYLTPTANIAGLTSGYQGAGFKTVLPASASAKMDFRLVPEMRPNDIFNKLRRHLDRHGFSDIELTLIGGVNPYRTSMDAPWVKLVAETAEEIYGRKPVMTPNMAGTGPMYDFGKTIGMPIATSGIDHPAHNIHAPNENITIDDFLLGAKQAALIIQRFAERGAK
jgi:acetylornithine deacetylase/succinyl-diaminopimelate desuccinylase-like protein